ncbi:MULTISPECIES: hypothetical protein [unclassified Rhizobium]|uniref:hypothetical protein n=1 Tax=unclassified Rhizobium TaxID=2613769 RepID=UPI0006FDF1EA|nr:MULTISPECIES: hypothetical protein [unclassified Rhizobium]KQV35774.1 hypothetical protein ASC86_11290 [Rhizobium sp. Root1212]KRD25881.1 hypothetical protein ASE37_11285 [Rhizobium sp. Root268]
MSVQNVRAAIERFLAYDKPQVLCIRGAWGTGKTYTWDDVLKAAAAGKKIKAKKYAKASLFGLNSIKELKREIFQSAIDIDQIGKPFDIDNVNNVVDNLKSWGKWALNKASFVHEDAMTAAIEVAALFAREQLILIDDLERKGEDLRSVDVLGYISQLRDDRLSKVVLLLNDEELKDETEFTSYLEKVVDVYLRFEPTCEEVARIAIPETDKVSVLVRDNAIALGITNVRVIRKLHALVNDLLPLIGKYSDIVTVNAAAVITLLGWSHFQPKKAPPLEYLKRVNTYSPKQDDVDLDMKWRDLLLKYHYTHTSDFDLVLLKGIENGYFDKGEIEKHAAELDRADARNQVEQEVRAIWDDMHYSFTKPAQGILDKFFECYMRNIEFMTLSDMSIFERLFRELEDGRSHQLVDRYIEVNKTKPDAFDVNRLERFGNELTPPVKEKIVAAEAEQAPKLNPDEVLIALGKRGYEEELYDVAAKLPVSEFIRILKSYEGSKLSDIISGMRQYLNTGGLDPRIHTIMDKAGLALRQIAEESPINKRRAMRLGLIQRLDARDAEAAGGEIAEG